MNIEEQTKEEKIKLFDFNIERHKDYLKDFSNQQIDINENKNIFLELLEEFNEKLFIVDKPVFTYDNKNFEVKSRMVVDKKEIFDYFYKCDKIFLYCLYPIYSDENNFLIVRFLDIPNN